MMRRVKKQMIFFFMTIYRYIARSIGCIEKAFPQQTLVGYPENWISQSDNPQALKAGVTAAKVFNECAALFDRKKINANEIQLGYV